VVAAETPPSRASAYRRFPKPGGRGEATFVASDSGRSNISSIPVTPPPSSVMATSQRRF
jgi:hypothetical protein